MPKIKAPSRGASLPAHSGWQATLLHHPTHPGPTWVHRGRRLAIVRNKGLKAQLSSVLNSFFNRLHGATQRPTDGQLPLIFSNKRKNQQKEHVLRGQSIFYRIRWTQVKKNCQKAFDQDSIIGTVSEIKPLCCSNVQSWQLLFSPWTEKKIF